MSTGSGGYEPSKVEPDIYAFWEQGGWFHAEPDPSRPAFTIVIPPPNVTGALHLGHAINNTLQDILIRTHRMRGYVACWLPGTDHAGIATQAVVEKRLKKEQGWVRDNKNPEHREFLVGKIREWKDEYEARILGQLRRMGCSCDWQRTRFTLDEGCAKAVYETFFRMFRDGLIYRGTRLVNWDCELQTAVADDELYHETVRGHLWHIRYPICGTGLRPVSSEAGVPPAVGAGVPPAVGAGIPPAGSIGVPPVRTDAYLVVATTRPETMLADTAVAVHPEDERYKHLIGKQVVLPLTGRTIPVIADDILVKREFGTGVVKVTPGHDPNDYECGKRHGLPMLNMMTPDGRVHAGNAGEGGKYAGLKLAEARKQVVADLEAAGLLEKVEPYETDVGHSDRSKTPIQPYLSEQWFLKMDRLAEMALEAVRDGRVRFFPERYAKTYLDWLSEKRDWCISRQLWWGHRIPVWTKRLTFAEFLALGHENNDVFCLDALNATDYSTYVTNESGRSFQLRKDGSADFMLNMFEGAQSEEEAVLERPLTWRICLRNEDARIYDYSRRTLKHLLLELGFEQDNDVLDTWFSSALWPHSTFGWPEKSAAHSEPSRPSDPSRAREGAVATEGITGGAGASSSAPERNSAQLLPHGRGSDQRGSDQRSSDQRGSDQRGSERAPRSDLAYFYPTSVLSTARDIITLWVARMVIDGLYNTGRVPFQHVLIHPTIQDAQGRRMSKSLGNGVDPTDLIELYGADAMRFVLASMAGETQDVRVPVKPVKLPDGREVNSSERFELGRNFCNKLWQVVTGFVLPNLGARGESEAVGTWEGGNVGTWEGGNVGREERAQATAPGSVPTFPGSHLPTSAGENRRPAGALYQPRDIRPDELHLEDRWILSRLATCIGAVDDALAHYRFSDAMGTLYNFFWSDFCDWYVELIKPRLFVREESGELRRLTTADAQVARQVLAWALDQTLRLLHPVIPFITEALWAKLNEVAPLRGVSTLVQVEEASSGPEARKTHTGQRPVPQGPVPQGPAPHAARALIVADWPTTAGLVRDAALEAEMTAFQDVIRAIREIRNSINSIRSQKGESALRSLPQALIRADAAVAAKLTAKTPAIQRLGQVDALDIGPHVAKPPGSMSQVLTGAGGARASDGAGGTVAARGTGVGGTAGSGAGVIEVYVPAAGLADLQVEVKRLTKERTDLVAHIGRIEAKLSTESFVAKAPPAVVEAERGRLQEARDKLSAIERHLAELGG